MRVLVKRGDIATSKIESDASTAIDEGEVLLAIEQFAITANNITYAAMGDSMRYWDFFPAPDGFGVVPVWGHARVEASNVEQIAVGERLYGYLPMGSHLIVKPGNVKAGGFVDTASHRAHLASVYNQYRRLAGDPGHHPQRENVRSVFEPLFLTSWLIREMFVRENWYGADTVVMTSASSKTALALAQLVRSGVPDVERVGLTSVANVEFVKRTGLYNRVLAYDDLAQLRGTQAVSVDFAGNGAVLRSVHEALGEGLKHSSLVGLTHWDERGGAGEMPGPKPVLFFAPDHVAAVVGNLGGEGFARAVAGDWGSFAASAEALVRIEAVEGLDAAAEAFAALVAGTARPEVATVVRLS